jgi:hypothetical protein
VGVIAKTAAGSPAGGQFGCLAAACGLLRAQQRRCEAVAVESKCAHAENEYIDESRACHDFAATCLIF